MDDHRTDTTAPLTAGNAADSIEDVEGHSIYSAIAISAALRARTPQTGDQARKRADENLTPLTKPFPSMRDGRLK